MSIPFTIDGTEIPADAPRAQSLTDTQAADLSAAAETYRENVLHLHADVADRVATITASNCPEGMLAFTFGDGSFDVEQRVDQGATPTVEHTYPSDGVFTATVTHSNGDRAQLQIAVNWPPYDAEEPPA